MGLDQYAFAVNPNYVKESEEDRGGSEEIAYWRKHNRLQGFMSKLAIKKGLVKSDAEFNCVDLELTEEDLGELEQAIISFKLPETNGFFFGSDSYGNDKNGHLHDQDMAFLANAGEALKQGFKVVYNCWW